MNLPPVIPAYDIYSSIIPLAYVNSRSVCFSSLHIFRNPPPPLFVLSCLIGVIANNVMFCVCRGEAICVFHVWHEVFPALPPGETQTHSYGYASIHRTLFKLIQLWDSVVLQIAHWDCIPWLLAAYLFYVTILHTAIIAAHSLTAVWVNGGGRRSVKGTLGYS